MEFIRFLRAESDAFDLRLLIAAILTGIITGGMVALVVAAAETPKSGLDRMWALAQFGVCFVLFVRTREHVLARIASIVAEVIGQVRARITNRIACAELRQFESLGQNAFYTALSQDTVVLSESATPIINATSSTVVTVFALACIAFVSPPAFVAVTGMIGLAIAHFLRKQRVVNRALSIANERERQFFHLFEHLLEGFTEVKINRQLHDDLLDNHLHRVGAETVELKQLAGVQAAALIVFSQGFFYLLIGFMLFVWPAFSGLPHDDVVRIVTLILFIIGPIGEAVGALPAISRAAVAIGNIYRLEDLLGRLQWQRGAPVADPVIALPPGLGAAEDGGAAERVATASKEDVYAAFSTLSLRDAVFAYQTDDHFELGPIDLEIRRGELLFLVGGNGSGKSTLLKVLTGLYEASSGQLLVDGERVSRGDLDAYRTLFSIIFHDFHLFDRLYGLTHVDEARADRLIERMQLKGLTRVAADGSVTRVALSTGQRKRLALMVAQLQNRPVIVLDEWAADQDPQFRQFFYRVLLPELAAGGQTIIAATHDDHYFDVADRILKLDSGRLEPFSPGGPTHA